MSGARYYVEERDDEAWDGPDLHSLWGAAPPERLYVVAEWPGPTSDDSIVFTVSPDPRCAGWITDNGANFYGLPLHVAEAIAARYNAASGK